MPLPDDRTHLALNRSRLKEERAGDNPAGWSPVHPKSRRRNRSFDIEGCASGSEGEHQSGKLYAFLDENGFVMKPATCGEEKSEYANLAKWFELAESQ